MQDQDVAQVGEMTEVKPNLEKINLAMSIDTVAASKFKRETYLLLKPIEADLLKELVKVKAYIAGGAITSVFTSTKIRDFDLYFPDQDAITAIHEYLISKEAKIVSQTSNAITYKYDKHTYQVIKVATGTPADIFPKFDFTICMGLYAFAEETFYFHSLFLLHNSQRKLVFNNGTLYPICSLIRTKKYIGRGYSMSGVEDIKLALTINNLQIKTYKELKEQLQGIDTLFLKPITDVLLSKEETNYDFSEFLGLLEDLFSSCLEKLNLGEKHDDVEEPELF